MGIYNWDYEYICGSTNEWCAADYVFATYKHAAIRGNMKVVYATLCEIKREARANMQIERERKLDVRWSLELDM